MGVFPVNPPFPFRTLSRNLKSTVSAFHISAAADGGRASAERTAEIKLAETKLWANLISAVEALCTAGIQEAQHLNRASEKTERVADGGGGGGWGVCQSLFSRWEDRLR